MAQIEMGSLFAGIGGFDLAAERAGFRVAWHSEIDKYSSRVLKHRWPNVPNLGDINDIRDPQWVDILAGGFPCQSYSVAGNRGGLADDRGALWWQYHRLIDQIRPTWVVGENVPGLLSSAGGRDFETIIRSLTEIGYGVVWSVLDSQYFGVPQRRRRVFIVGHSGGRPRPEILALAEGMFGHPAPSREEEQDVAASLESRATPDRLRAERGHIVGFSPGASDVALGGEISPTVTARHGDQGGVVYAPEVAGTLTRRDDKGPREDIAEPNMVTYVSKTAQTGSNGLGISGKDIDGEETAHTLDSSGPEAVIQVFEDDRRTGPRMHDEVGPTLTARMGQGGNNMPMVFTQDGPTAEEQERRAVSFSQNQRGEVREADVAPALNQGGGKPGQGYPTVFQDDIRIRKLTPLECERLQGFPDGWTDIKKNSDTQRYKQLGNAVTVNTVQWIMERIAATYDDLYLNPKTDR